MNPLDADCEPYFYLLTSPFEFTFLSTVFVCLDT